MKQDRKTRRRSQQGIALLIAIFVLLLISVVAIALLVSSGTETALGANYRSSSTVYYGALAGLEEARGRLLPKNPNYLGNSVATLPIGQAVYLLNQLPTETITPWDSSDKYYDNEFQSEFGYSATGDTPVYSVWNNSPGNTPGPVYKWVRINAATEQSIYIDVDQDGTMDPTTPLFYDPAHIDNTLKAWPSLVVGPTPTAAQALEITALAALPNGTKKILQYLVAPIAVNIAFPAAFTLDGYSDSFQSPDHSAFVISGNSDGGDNACSPTGPVPYPVPAIGVPDSSDATTVKGAIPTAPTNEQGNFTGTGSPPYPSVAQVSLPANLQTVQSLDRISQTVLQNADVVITGPATETSLPSAMSSTNPMTIAVQGDFHLGTTIPSGYGLLLVTGTFTYDTGANWNGIVLVIGKGDVEAYENGAGGVFNGATLVAQTRDLSGNLLPGPNPGPAAFNDTLAGNVGRGFIYNCSWIQAAEAPLTYKVLAFHEIPQ